MVNYQLWLSLSLRDQILYINHMINVLIEWDITDPKDIIRECKLNTNDDKRFLEILDILLKKHHLI